MGQCTQKIKPPNDQGQQAHKRQNQSLAQNKQSNESIQYKVQIENIKIKDAPKKTVSLLFDFDKLSKDIPLPQKRMENNRHKWVWDKSETIEFDFSMRTEEMKTKFMTISIKNKKQKTIGFVKESLYDIATGPQSHDLLINWKNKRFQQKSRLSFNIKLYQQLKLDFIIKKVIVSLANTVFDNQYALRLRIITPNPKQDLETEVYFLSQTEENEEENIDLLRIREGAAINISQNYNFRTKTSKIAGPDTSVNPISYQEALPSNSSPIPSQNLLVKPQIDNQSISSAAFGDNRHQSISKEFYKEHIHVSTNGTHNQKKYSRIFQPNTDICEVMGHSGLNMSCSLNVKEIQLSTLQIKVFFMDNSQNHNQPSNNNNASKEEQGSEQIINQIAETYISFNKFFQNTVETIEQQNNCFEHRVSDNIENLWYNGQVVGSIQVHLELFNQKQIKQMITGVRTEKEIESQAPIVYDNTSSFQANLISDFMKQLSEQKQILQQTFFKYQNQSNSTAKERQSYLNQVKESFNKIQQIVVKQIDTQHDNEPIYCDFEKIFQAQYILIDLAKHMHQYINDLALINLREQTFQCLKIILNREEFNLAEIGFTQNAYNFFLQNGPETQMKKVNTKIYSRFTKKVNLAVQYYDLLNLIHKSVLELIPLQAHQSRELEFIKNWVAVAYFKMPKFRNQLLASLQKNNNVEIDEWRGTEYKLDEILSNKKYYYKQINDLFDWEQFYYQYITNDKYVQQKEDQFNQIYENTAWQVKFEKREDLFYQFVCEWIEYVRKIMYPLAQIPWEVLPGYGILLKTVLTQLKVMDILNYNKWLITTSTALLHNEKILNTYITILYKKTRIHDNEQIVMVYYLINQWFQFLIENNKNIPTHFSDTYFLRGIKLTINEDKEMCIFQVLNMIYSNFKLFSPEIRYKICKFLLGKRFFKLFMHWSKVVRLQFHNLLVYRIYHLHQFKKTPYQTIREIKQQLNDQLIQADKLPLIDDYILAMFENRMNVINSAYLVSRKRTALNFQQKIRHLNSYYLKMKSKLENRTQFIQSQNLKRTSILSEIITKFDAPKIIKRSENSVIYEEERMQTNPDKLLLKQVQPSDFAIQQMQNQQEVQIQTNFKPVKNANTGVKQNTTDTSTELLSFNRLNSNNKQMIKKPVKSKSGIPGANQDIKRILFQQQNNLLPNNQMKVVIEEQTAYDQVSVNVTPKKEKEKKLETQTPDMKNLQNAQIPNKLKNPQNSSYSSNDVTNHKFLQKSKADLSKPLKTMSLAEIEQYYMQNIEIAVAEFNTIQRDYLEEISQFQNFSAENKKDYILNLEIKQIQIENEVLKDRFEEEKFGLSKKVGFYSI